MARGNAAPSGIITEEHLHHLENAADLIQGRLEGSTSAPRGLEHLAELRAVCDEWIDYVVAVPGLPDNLRIDLAKDLRHVTWLLDQVELLGAGVTVGAAQRVLGGVTSGLPDVPASERHRWQEKYVKLGRVLGKLARAVVLGDAALDASGAMIDRVDRYWDSVAASDTFSGPADPPDSTTPRALPVGDDDAEPPGTS